MPKSITVAKKRGRPPGRTVPVAIPIRLATEQVAALDRYAEAEGKTRSEAVRTALAEHLKAKGYLK
jgi:metal-responsive CopG/Arc/MetJ family transcriptional regulator